MNKTKIYFFLLLVATGATVWIIETKNKPGLIVLISLAGVALIFALWNLSKLFSGEESE
jgi:hypothetical protein